MKKKKRNRLVPFLLSILAGIMLLPFDRCYPMRCIAQHRYLELYAATLGGLFAMIWLHTVVHELGHLVCGLVSGYRFSSFRIGSLMLMKEKGRLVLRRHSIPGTAGQCLMAPPELVDGMMPVTLYNLGGSVANVVFAVVCAAVSNVLPYGTFWEYFWGLGAVIGLVTALSNGIPRKTETVVNDGWNARSLRRDTSAVRALWIQLEVARRQTQGQRLGELPAEWFELPTEDEMQNNLCAHLAVLHAVRKLEEGAAEEADALMESLIAADNAIIPIQRQMLRLDRAWIELMGQNRPEVLGELLTQEAKWLFKAMKRTPSVIRTEYALAMLSERDEKKAEQCLCRFEKAAKRYAFRHEIESERKLLEIITERAKETA